MKSGNYKKLTHKLIDLDKKAEEFDKLLTDLRTEINNALWDLIELKKVKLKAEQKKTTE